MSFRSTPDSLTLQEDIAPARWVEEQLQAWGRDGVSLRSMMPANFPAYARIFHPASVRYEGGEYSRVRWATIAEWTGAVVHPLMQIGKVTRTPFPYKVEWGEAPDFGSLPFEECLALVELLKDFTATAGKCYLGYWDGFGGFTADKYQDAPRIKAQNREYVLFHSAIEDIPTFVYDHPRQSPNLWWPEDRAWCVATDIDLYDTFVGGSESCIERILCSSELEALQVTIDVRVDCGADIINP